MQDVFCHAKSSVNLLFCGWFDGIDFLCEPVVCPVGTNQVLQDENQSFINLVGFVAVGGERFYQGREESGKIGSGRVQVLKEVGGGIWFFERVIEKSFFCLKNVVEGRSGKILLEKYGEHAGADAFPDATGVSLIVVQDKEIAGADGDVAPVYFIPFFAGQDCLKRQAADMIVAVALGAGCVEDHVVPAEPEEMLLFIKPGGGMVGKRGEVHRLKIEQICTLRVGWRG